MVGLLIVSDPDNCGPKGVWQTHNCSTRQTSDGRFTIDNNVVKVKQARLRKFANFCKIVLGTPLQVAKSDINYESNSSLSIVVHCVDTGSPQQYRDELLVISVVDVNENPISLTMTGGVIAENSSPQALASFTTTDPDNEFTLRQVVIFHHFLVIVKVSY